MALSIVVPIAEKIAKSMWLYGYKQFVVKVALTNTDIKKAEEDHQPHAWQRLPKTWNEHTDNPKQKDLWTRSANSK